MLTTVRYVESEGKRIIIGFDRRVCDPVSTETNALEIMKNSEALKAVITAREHVEGLHKEDRPVSEVEEAMKELYRAHEIYVREFLRTRKENPVYFELRKDESAPDRDKLLELNELLKTHKIVTVEGEVINDTL